MNFPPVFILILVLVFLATTFVTGLLYKLALANKLPALPLLPAPRPRDVHLERKPRIGGVAIWLCITLTLLILPHTPLSYLVDFAGPKGLGVDRAVWGILGGGLVLLVFGILDDLYSLRWPYLLLSQVLAIMVVIGAGIGPEFFRLPFYAVIRLDGASFNLPFWLGGATVHYASALFTLIWMGVTINVLNFFDGLDGLAGSMALTAGVVLMFVSLNLGYLATALLAVVLVGAAAGYLPWNWYPSKIFMGTVGSQLIGYILGVIAIISGAKVATAILVLGIPVLDAFLVIARRLKAGVSPFQADQRHLHHRLLKIGLPVPGVVLLINFVSVVFGSLALATSNSSGKGILTILLIIFMALFVMATYWFERKAWARDRRLDRTV